ncbi:hypothetical protein ACFQ5N_10065 [Lutibacter holmesii]|uniref:Uncharacterized protein n=1 Tax=Lutibacter holmesii TaxID=1137985 RepID=A0ABW3WQ49_9FLAO
MRIQDFVGTYTIVGSNQDASAHTYKGTLHLTLDENQRILATWRIENNQTQVGTGFFKDGILVINFSYIGEDHNTFKGVVVYRCITTNLLDGFWSEKHGDPLYLGSERCYRIQPPKELLN